jgi:predicted PurR-regulated permease PerM
VNRHQSPASGAKVPMATPRRLTTTDWYLPFAVQIAILGMFVLALGATLYVTRTILIPVAAAAIIGMTLAPFARRAQRHHIPPWLFAVLVIVLLIAVIHIGTILLTDPISNWIAKAPELGAIVRDKLRAMDNAVATIRGLQPGGDSGDSGFKVDIAPLIEPVLGFLTPALGQLIIFLAALFFFLIGQTELRSQLILVFSGQEARLRAIQILNEIEEHLAHYAATVTIINFALGCFTAIGVYFIGLPSALAWGMLAFVCNFVPYVGPAVVLCVLFGVGLITFPSLGHALVGPIFYVTLTTLEGHFITPNIVGQRFELGPLAVFLALVFWTWIWGPVGGFLAVPILIISVSVLNHLFLQPEVQLPD